MTTYDSAARRLSFVEEIHELIRFREFLRLLVNNSITTRYKRSVFGILWTLVNPLMTMAVLTFVFSEIFHSTTPYYPAYLLIGITFWNFFGQTTNQAVNSLVWGAGLLKRTYIPRSIFAVSALGNGVFNLFVSLIPLVAIMIFIGQPFYVTWVFFPFAILITMMFTLGVGLFISALAVQFTDVVDMYQLAIQILFWFTPIMYPKSVLPTNLSWLINLNPLYHILELFRVPIYNGWLPGPNTMIAAVGSSVLMLLIGWWFFTSRADKIVYRI